MSVSDLGTVQLSWPAEALAVLTLARPEAANTLNTRLVADLRAAVACVRSTSQAKALVVTGAGKHFCAGADLREAKRPEDWLGPLRSVFDQLAGLEVASFAAINGSCMGGGLELALACDFRVAARSAKLGLPEISFGALPAAGGPQRLARLVSPATAKWLVMSGERLTAEEAERGGLVDWVVDDGEALDRALEMAHRLTLHAAYALQTAKRVIDHGLDRSLAAALEAEYAAIDGMASPDERSAEARKAMERSATYARIFGASR